LHSLAVLWLGLSPCGSFAIVANKQFVNLDNNDP